MDVEVRDALANSIVDGHERTLGAKSSFHGMGEELAIREKRSQQIDGEIHESFVMSFGNQQRVTREEGAMIEKPKRHLVFKNAVVRSFAADDLAKGAVRTLNNNHF